jgi:hypothetical protein
VYVIARESHDLIFGTNVKEYRKMYGKGIVLEDDQTLVVAR